MNLPSYPPFNLPSHTHSNILFNLYSLPHSLSHHLCHSLSLSLPSSLGAVSDVTQLLSDLLRTWSYLEPLFIGSDEVKRELPFEATRFEEVDTEVKNILQVCNTDIITLFSNLFMLEVVIQQIVNALHIVIFVLFI